MIKLRKINNILCLSGVNEDFALSDIIRIHDHEDTDNKIEIYRYNNDWYVSKKNSQKCISYIEDEKDVSDFREIFNLKSGDQMDNNDIQEFEKHFWKKRENPSYKIPKMIFYSEREEREILKKLKKKYEST